MSKEQIEHVPLQEPSVTSGEEPTERAQWSNTFQGFIAQLGYSVGLANLWRFPYVCQRNGGGAFLIPHIICIVVVAIPLFFLEVALGQFSRKGPIRVWAMCPALKGIGYGILIVNCVIVPYYSMVFAWALYYLYNSFSIVLPWTTCGNSWNTPQCVTATGSTRAYNSSTEFAVLSHNTTRTADFNLSETVKNEFGHTSTEEFWQDALVVTLLGEFTSVYAGFVIFATVGFLAHKLHVPVADVITSGPGIAFVVYPEAVSLLPVPQLWSVLFFLVVLMMGFDTMFWAIEAVTGCVEDILPKRFHKRPLPTVIAAVFMGAVFPSGMIFTTSAGVYMFQFWWYKHRLMKTHGGSLKTSQPCVGLKRFSVDVEAMIGKRLPVVYKLMCFIVVPVLLLASMVLTIAAYKPPAYADYEYPPIAVTIGWCIAVLPVVPIPVTMVIHILMQRGSFVERVKSAMTPSPEWQRCRQLYGVTEDADVSNSLEENLLHVFNR